MISFILTSSITLTYTNCISRDDQEGSPVTITIATEEIELGIELDQLEIIAAQPDVISVSWPAPDFEVTKYIIRYM